MRRRGGREDARRGSRITHLSSGLAAILAAGGSGVRVGADLPKQFLDLAGRPMIEWSFEAITRAGITDVTVVVPPERVGEVQRTFGSAARVTPGGRTRQESVRLGLEQVTAEQVVVHDAARPFAPKSVFSAVVEALSDSDAAVPGLQMQETTKIVRGAVVVQTLDREDVWNIQTPQAFWTARIRDAHERALAEGVDGTDDAQLIEHYGGRVVVVEGHPDSFKVTTSEDVDRANLLAERTGR